MQNDIEYELKGPDAEGKGCIVEGGFLVKAGSLARRETTPSGKSVATVHQRLLADGVVVEHDGQFRFLKDHLFNSPSGAAAAVLGRTANGWISWKSSDGRTLSEVKRVARMDQGTLLNEQQRQAILTQHQQLLDSGKLPAPDQLQREYTAFRSRFGPEALAERDGQALLELMHDHGDTLVYWLEFKNDDEFAGSRFGSIAGGSALKFRVFRRKETALWQAAGEKGNKPANISLDTAIEIARSHRDQLLKGVELLTGLPEGATDEDYAELQDQLDEVAPDVSRLAWGHKYFSLLFPDKLDDYHSPDWQRFHLLKLLQLPPEGDGRYICAGRFVAVAEEVGLSMNHLTSTLNALHGRLHQYWRIGTTSGTTGASFWPMMQEESCIAVGWPGLGDLSWVDSKTESREKLKKLLEAKHPSHPAALGRDCSQLVHFVVDVAEGAVVLAAEGMTVHGVGRVVGGYEFRPEFEFAHHRKVEWLTLDQWQLPEPAEGLRSTVRELGKSHENLLAIEQRIQAPPPQKPPGPISPPRSVRLRGIPGRLQAALERKGQAILYGPPGTGKTYWAERAVCDLAALSAFGKVFEDLDDEQNRIVLGDGDNRGLVRICCFHPAYGYEDFIEGYRPRTVNGQVSFELRGGVFKNLCLDAAATPGRSYFLIVDEINRGDIPRIFGELLTTLEKDKRGKRVILPVSQDSFTVPRNVFLVGTMNTADRSISLLDAALRRRFGFIELMPDGSVLHDSAIAGIALRPWFEALNARIREHVGRDARNLQIGHSYLMHGGGPLKDLATFKRAVRDDIIPLLEEYCYEDYATLGMILGEQVVDVAAARIRHELFDEGLEDDLVQALLASFADIAASSGAIATDQTQPEPDEDEEEVDS